MRLIKGNVERIAVTEKQVARLKAEGFVSLTAPTEAEVRAEHQVITLEEMTAAELKALAKERGLNGYSGLSKEDLLAVLKDGDSDG